MPETIEVDVDSRNRVSLGKFATAKRYIVTAQEDGSISLVPATTISLRELEVLRNPELHGRIQRGLEEVAAGRSADMTAQIMELAAEADANGEHPFDQPA